MLRVCLVLLLLQGCVGFKWKLSEVLVGDKQLSFTESHMFSSNHGPVIMEQGTSYITVDMTVVT